MSRRRHARISATALAAFLALSAGRVLAAADFESPPTLKASDIVPADLLRSAHHSLAEDVINDGFMNTFHIESDYGPFTAYGQEMLAIRVHEVAALAELDQVSKTEVFLKAAGQAAVAPVQSAVEFAARPVETVKGVPGGVKRLFKSTKAKVEAGVDTVQERSEADEGAQEGAEAAGGESGATQAKQAAKGYAQDYLGVTGAERRWAQTLEVDPYSSNVTLRKAIGAVAKVDAAARFSTRLIMPAIPGLGTVAAVNDLVWSVDPIELKARNIKRLEAMGVDEAAIETFYDNPWYSPTRQTYLIEALVALDGTAGRPIVLQQAAAVESEEEAAFLVQSLRLYAWFHGDQSRLARLLPGTVLPLAVAADGRMVFLAAVDYLAWTEEIAAAADRLEAASTGNGAGGRELWLRGIASPRSRSELEGRGWTVRDRVEITDDAPAAPPGS